jgi:L-alanine-DL-glutamate epimerase-like enolase superfamily enzyme
MFERGSVALAQPSVNKIGGITEIQKIIALVDAAGRASAAEPGLGCDPDPELLARYATHAPYVVRRAPSRA